jgi:hypothetical protein
LLIEDAEKETKYEGITIAGVQKSIGRDLKAMQANL